MKKLFLIVCLMLSVVVSQAQNNSLTTEQLANMTPSELEAYQVFLKSQLKNKTVDGLPQVSKLQEYAVVGKALGQAFKECWSTVSTDAEKFAQSPAGKWTAFLITWKVMGKDAVDLMKTSVRWLVGICLISAVSPFFMLIVWKNCISKKVLVKKENLGLFKSVKVYSDNPHDPIHSGYIAGYGAFYSVFLVIVCFAMFA